MRDGSREVTLMFIYFYIILNTPTYSFMHSYKLIAYTTLLKRMLEHYLFSLTDQLATWQILRSQ